MLLELKAVETVLPVHQAQVITCLKISPQQLGLLVNLHVPLIKDGIRRLFNPGLAWLLGSFVFARPLHFTGNRVEAAFPAWS